MGSPGWTKNQPPLAIETDRSAEEHGLVCMNGAGLQKAASADREKRESEAEAYPMRSHLVEFSGPLGLSRGS